MRQGIDIPDIEAVVLAGAEKSHIATVQSIGRGSRKKSHNHFYVSDFIDTGSEHTLSHGLIREQDYRALGAVVYQIGTPLSLIE